jgi:NADH-quinone oxidoreductase subunit L
MMGMIFHSGTKEPRKDEIEDHPDQPAHEHGEAGWVMLAPLAILAALTVAIGLVGPWVSDFLSTGFSTYFTNSLHLVVASSAATPTPALSGLTLEIVVAASSIAMIVIGAVPAYRLYISHKSDPETTVAKSGVLRGLWKFLWNRWYIDAFYQKVFVDTTLAIRAPLQRYIEKPIDYALNESIPNGFKGLSKAFRKIQTGISSVNMLYFIMFIAILLLILWLGGLL